MFPNELQLMCMYTLKDLEEARFARTAAALREILKELDSEQQRATDLPQILGASAHNDERCAS